MRSIILATFFMLMLQGCDAVDDMKGMFEKQELAQEFIKSKYGWESQLGFNINNGILTQVTVVLNADQVRGETVERLEEITKEVVVSVFKSKPQAIYIQIASQPEA
jgi:predicted YcjX-like family ATPase